MQYKGRGMLGGSRSISATVLLIMLLSVMVMSTVDVLSTSSAGGSETDLTIWDSTDTEAGSLTRYSAQNTTFYANFTNTTSGLPLTPLGGTNCNITFNTTGSWLGPFNMSYDSGSGLYVYNKTFSWKGTFDFNVSCMANASFSNEWLNATDNNTISNSYPSISPKPLPTVTCYEDSCTTYNLSNNCSDADANDVLTYSRDAETHFSCFSLNNQTGIIDLSGCDNSNEAVSGYVMSLIVTDSDDKPDIVDQTYTIIAVNDDPIINITDCEAESPAAEDDLLECDVIAIDEEDGTQASGNLNFTANVTWFGIDLTSGQVSFTPSNSEVGTHHINITVNDTNGVKDWATLVLTITNVNDPPNLTIACYNISQLNSTNATEDAEFTCWLNATDIDSVDNVSFNSNTSWFSLNTSVQLSYDGNGNFSSLVNFTPTDAAVGSHQINITVNDSTALDWRLINFSVINIPDTPFFQNIVNRTNITGFEYVSIYYPILGFDNDTLWNSSEYVNFTHNQTSMFNFTYLNTTANIISFIPGDGEAGAYETRINITDGNGNAVYVVINLTIYDNAPPYAPNITLTCYDSNSTYSTPCYYNISQNVTEPNGNSFNFTDNSTFFNINTTTGEINFTGNDSIVGNHTVRINLTDSHGATNFTIVLFEIINVNDAPSLGLKNWTARQTVLFSFDLTNNITDQDTNVSSSIFNESFSFSVVNASNTSQSLMTFFNITVNGTIHIRPNILHIGNYTLNVTVNDSTGASDTQLIYFTIHAYNNPPQFTWVCNNSRQATENNKFTCWLNATDIDSSNLTFQTNTSWFDFNTSAQYINSTLPNASVLANFTPTGSEVGNHSILINVTDDEGAYDEVIFDFEVLSVNNPPTINWWRWISNNPIDMSTTETAFNASENSTIIFRHISSDPDSDSLSYSWVINGTENTTSANHTYWIPFKYTNLSIMNVTLIIDDHRKGYDQQEWNVTIIHVNRPPDLYKNITNQTWPENVDETLNISEYIRDLDGDNLSFNYNLTSDCQSTNCMSISFSGTSGNYVATFTPASNWWGVTNVTIVANDSGYTVNSNSFKLNITYVPRQVRYVTVSSGGGGSGGSSASLVASLSMTIDPFEIITPKEIVRAPVFLENTGEVALNDINLSAEADGFDITLDLADEYFESISPSSNASTYLTINITKAKKDRYEIRMLAFVSSPGLNDSATIYIETTPINKTMVDVRIEFVKDLFEENPECMELMELVFEAEQAIEAENLERAKNLTKLAIDNCRDMIKYGQVTGQLPAQSQPMSIIIEPLHIAVIFIIGISAWYGISRLQRSRWGSKRYRFIPG